MNAAINRLQEAIFGKSRETAVATHTCVTCTRQNVSGRQMRTDAARREYYISGMCQACQDAVFTKEGTGGR